MLAVTHYPLVLSGFSFLALWLAARLGWFFCKKHALSQELRDDFGLILASTLTLLGLVIGFSFSMAASRYDQRKQLEAEEANAIGTEYLRADVLPAASATSVHTLLKSYLDQRILFYTMQDDEESQKTQARTTRLSAELWAAVAAVSGAAPSPVIALALSGMNDVLNTQGYTTASYWNRIPTAAWVLMLAIAVGCNLMVGFGSRSLTDGSKLLPILPLVVAIAFMLIADIDAPRHGLIRVRPQNLDALAQSLPPSQGP